MLVLLPPSEGKATAGRGRPLALDGLSLPALNRRACGRTGRAGPALRGRRGQGVRRPRPQPRAARRDRQERRAAHRPRAARRPALHRRPLRRPRPGHARTGRRAPGAAVPAGLLRVVGGVAAHRPGAVLSLLHGGTAARRRRPRRLLAAPSRRGPPRGRGGRARARPPLVRLRGGLEARPARWGGGPPRCGCFRFLSWAGWRGGPWSATSTRRRRGGCCGLFSRPGPGPSPLPGWPRCCGISVSPWRKLEGPDASTSWSGIFSRAHRKRVPSLGVPQLSSAGATPIRGPASACTGFCVVGRQPSPRTAPLEGVLRTRAPRLTVSPPMARRGRGGAPGAARRTLRNEQPCATAGSNTGRFEVRGRCRRTGTDPRTDEQARTDRRARRGSRRSGGPAPHKGPHIRLGSEGRRGWDGKAGVPPEGRCGGRNHRCTTCRAGEKMAGWTPCSTSPPSSPSSSWTT